MSYKFGQFRKSQYSDYLLPLDYILNDLRVDSHLFIFLGKYLKLIFHIKALNEGKFSGKPL